MEIPEVCYTPHTVGAWLSDGRLFAASWPPAASDHDAAVCSLLELNLSTGAVTASLNLPWVPRNVAVTSEGTVWIQGLDDSDVARPRHVLLRWRDTSQDPLREIDLASDLGDDAVVSLVEPVGSGQMAALIRAQRDVFVHAVDTGGGTFEQVRTEVIGGFPDARVIVTFRPFDAPDITGALSINLFTLDGSPRRRPGTFFDVGIMEEMRTGGLDRLRAQTPDEHGLVWLWPPARLEGLRPQEPGTSQVT